jgi:hypothetical protein
MKYETLEPTPEGYRMIALMHAQSILSEISMRKRKGPQLQMEMLVQLVGFLAVKHPDQFRILLGMVRRAGEQADVRVAPNGG